MKFSKQILKNKSFNKLNTKAFSTSFADVKFKIDDIIEKQGATFLQMRFNNAVNSNDINKVNDLLLNFTGTDLLYEHDLLLEKLCQNIGNIYPDPYEIAAYNNNLPMLNYCGKHYEHFNNNTLYYAIYGASIRMEDDAKDMVEHLIKQRKLDIDFFPDFSHVTPLTSSIAFRQFKVALCILNNGASPTFPQRNSSTPGMILNRQNEITNFTAEEKELREQVIRKINFLIEKEAANKKSL